MTKEMREQIERLRALTPKLNAKVAKANRFLKATEALLVEELSLGVYAQTSPFEQIEEEDPFGSGEGYERWAFAYLAYGRVTGKYRLHVLRTIERRPLDGGDATWEKIDVRRADWTTIPNAEKVLAYTKIPELLNMIAEETTRAVERADATDIEMEDVFGEAPQGESPPEYLDRMAKAIDSLNEYHPTALVEKIKRKLSEPDPVEQARQAMIDIPEQVEKAKQFLAEIPRRAEEAERAATELTERVKRRRN
jgi:hypothetical protein